MRVPTFVLAAAGLLAMSCTSAAQDQLPAPSTGVRYAAIPNGAYSVVAQIRAKPGKEAELRKATLPLVALVRSDPKNLVYFLQENREAPGHFIFYEIFASKEDFEAHNAKPYVKAWFAKLPELAAGKVEVLRMQVWSTP